MKWMESESNGKEAELFEEKLVSLLSDCFVTSTKSQKIKRGKVWSNYHKIRTSEEHHGLWHSFLQMVGLTEVSPIFCQYVSDHMLHELASVHFPVINRDVTSQSTASELTCEETYGLRYAAGYVPRSLKKKTTEVKQSIKKGFAPVLGQLINN